MRIGHHAVTLDVNGRNLPDKTWGWEMPVLADFSPCTWALEDEPRPGCLSRRTVPVWDDTINTLANAREWAAKIFESDDRVASVSIQESVQEFDGCSWKVGRHVETIKRKAAAPAPTCEGGRHIWPTYQVGRCACGAVSSD